MLIVHRLHSYRRLLMGLAVVALTACELTVSRAITNAKTPERKNTRGAYAHCIGKVLYPKIQERVRDRPCNGIGDAKQEKFFRKKSNQPVTVAPRTFRIPISFVLASTVYDANPKRPRQAMTMAMNAKIPKTPRFPFHCRTRLRALCREKRNRRDIRAGTRPTCFPKNPTRQECLYPDSNCNLVVSSLCDDVDDGRNSTVKRFKIEIAS